MTFEILYCPFVLFCSGPSIKGAQVFPFAGFRIDLARIEPVFAELQFPNHRAVPFALSLFPDANHSNS